MWQRLTCMRTRSTLIYVPTSLGLLFGMDGGGAEPLNVVADGIHCDIVRRGTLFVAGYKVTYRLCSPECADQRRTHCIDERYCLASELVHRW